jgi:hypothetical protein
MHWYLSNLAGLAIAALLTQSSWAQVQSSTAPTSSPAPLSSQNATATKPATATGTAVYQILFRAQVFSP